MSLSVTCYPTPGKVKALRLCDDFARGVRAAGGTARVSNGVPAQLGDGAAVFYGVMPETAHLWRQAKAEGRDWYYIDNSYFDCTRGTHFRITKNAIQHRGIGYSNGLRRADLGITVKPWRDGGDHVVLCLQSQPFMQTVAGIDQTAWLDEIRATVARRQLRIRGWNGNKKLLSRTLHDDLKNAALLVTWSSAAAIEALIAGVPVLCGEQCAAFGVAVDQRDAWVDVLADHQWTFAEIVDGTAWRNLNGIN